MILVVVLSAAVVPVFKVHKEKNLTYLLAFSGAFLFGICCLHLFPELYSRGSATTGIFVIVGFLLQVVLEIWTKGIEHGHFHIDKELNYRFPFTLFFGLCLHAFIEGIPLTTELIGEVHSHSNSHSHAENTSFAFLWGILIHKIPISIILMTFLFHSGQKLLSSFIFVFIFALMAPTGAFLGQSAINTMEVLNIFLAIAVGTFLHVGTTILFESEKNHQFNLKKFTTVLLGFVIAYFASIH